MASTTVSVVIASGAGGDFLVRCLESLRKQAASSGTEIIVADRVGPQVRDRLASEFSFVNVLTADSTQRLSVPELRALAVSEAKSDIVAVIEEHCVAPPNWLEVIRSSFQAGDAAIGGPILDNNYARIRDWVVYFSEYHNYLPPWPDGERYLLNGANIAYSREKLLRFQDVLKEGYWEVVLHPELCKEGAFRAVSRMGIYHTGPFDYRYYLGQRYLLSRVWGGTQREKVSLGKRLIYLLVAPVFPFLLLLRIAFRVFKSGHRVGRFVLALPGLIPVALAYVWGEWNGYLRGVGNALELVE